MVEVYPHFTVGREVIVPDLIGFGESERPGVTMDATDYAESLAEFRGTPARSDADRCRKRPHCWDRPPPGLTPPRARQQAHPLLPTGLKESEKCGASGMVALVGLPGLNRFVYRNHLSPPFSSEDGPPSSAFGDPSRLNEEMVRALTTCAQQVGAETPSLDSLRGRLTFDIQSRLERLP